MIAVGSKKPNFVSTSPALPYNVIELGRKIKVIRTVVQRHQWIPVLLLSLPNLLEHSRYQITLISIIFKENRTEY